MTGLSYYEANYLLALLVRLFWCQKQCSIHRGFGRRAMSFAARLELVTIGPSMSFYPDFIQIWDKSGYNLDKVGTSTLSRFFQKNISSKLYSYFTLPIFYADFFEKNLLSFKKWEFELLSCVFSYNYLSLWWVEFEFDLIWLFTNRFRWFMLFAEINQIILKIYFLPILLTFLSLVAIYQKTEL